MKNLRILSLAALVLFIISSGCNKEPQDLVTQDAKTGGLVEVANALHVYQKGQTSKKFTTTLLVQQGSVTTQNIKVYKQFKTASGDVSERLFLMDIPVNNTKSSNVSFDVDYPSLAEGITINGTALDVNDDINLSVGDYWILSYESTTSENAVHVNGPTTKLSVSGRLAGTYTISQGYYYHPSDGGAVSADYSGDVRIVESVSEGVYRITSMGAWSDIVDGTNAIYFLADEANFTITIPKEYNGDVQKVWDGADEVATCQDDSDKLTAVTCTNTFEYTSDGKDVIKMSYGYIRTSGTRQFDDILVKQ